MAIDMKNYTGENYDSAAEGQQIESNSYLAATQQDDVEVYEEFLTVPPNSPAEAPVERTPEEPSRQELNFKALREEVDRIKAERDAERLEFKQNLDLLRANQIPQRAPDTEKSNRMFEMDKSEVPNVGEIEAALERQIVHREENLRAQIEELTVAQAHPDYAEVLEKFTAPLLRQKPHLAQGIRGADNKALYAYELGKMAQQMQAPAPAATLNVPTTPQANAQKMVENARKPATLAQAGGQSVLSKADYYATMSDADFMKIASKNLEGI